MPFISDEQIEQKANIEKEKVKIESKIKSNQITEKANEKLKQLEKPKSLTDPEMIKIMQKQLKRQPKPQEPKAITVKDIEKQLEINEFLEEKKEEQIEKMLEEPEVIEIKNEIINVMALPHTQAERRIIFQNLLRESKTVNNYVDDNVLFKMFNRANQNIKFGVVYSLKYLQTFNIHKQYIREVEQIKLQQQQQQPQQQQNIKNEDKK
jgi:hypothetical protein